MDRSAALQVVELRKAVHEHREFCLISYEVLYRESGIDLDHSHESTKEEDHERSTKH